MNTPTTRSSHTTLPTHPVTGPVAIVTGASQGLGLALAEALADAAGPSSSTPAAPTGSTPRSRGLAARTTVVGVAGDVTDPAHRAELARVAARSAASGCS